MTRSKNSTPTENGWKETWDNGATTTTTCTKDEGWRKTWRTECNTKWNETCSAWEQAHRDHSTGKWECSGPNGDGWWETKTHHQQ